MRGARDGSYSFVLLARTPLPGAGGTLCSRL
jgi:hypothetical protein